MTTKFVGNRKKLVREFYSVGATVDKVPALSREAQDPRLSPYPDAMGAAFVAPVGKAFGPFETPQGWLVIYHGVRQGAGGCLYRLGLALFDIDTPELCLMRGDEWFFGPEEAYERNGDVGNVVFPCGYTLAPDGDTLNLYYGAADSTIALATGSVRALRCGHRRSSEMAF